MTPPDEATRRWLWIPVEGPCITGFGFPRAAAERFLGTDMLTVVTCADPWFADRGVHVLWLDDWGATKELPVNFRAWALYGRSPIHGGALLCADDGSLTAEAAERVDAASFPPEALMDVMRGVLERDRD